MSFVTTWTFFVLQYSGLFFVEERLYGADRGEYRRGFVGHEDGLVVLARGHLAQGVDILHGEHVGGRVGLGCADCLGHAQYGVSFGLRVEDYGARFALGTQYFGLFHRLGLIDLGCLLSLGTQYERLFLTLGVEYLGTTVALGLHLLLHGHAHALGRRYVLQFHTVHLDAPLVGGIVEYQLKLRVDGVA